MKFFKLINHLYKNRLLFEEASINDESIDARLFADKHFSISPFIKDYRFLFEGNMVYLDYVNSFFAFFRFIFMLPIITICSPMFFFVDFNGASFKEGVITILNFTCGLPTIEIHKIINNQKIIINKGVFGTTFESKNDGKLSVSMKEALKVIDQNLETSLLKALEINKINSSKNKKLMLNALEKALDQEAFLLKIDKAISSQQLSSEQKDDMMLRLLSLTEINQNKENTHS